MYEILLFLTTIVVEKCHSCAIAYPEALPYLCIL